MGKLLKLVFFRLRKEKAPWIEAFIAIGYALLVVLIYYIIYQSAVASGTSPDDVGISFRVMVLKTMSAGYNIPAVLIVAGVASFFYTEINYGTLRNQIVSGYSRKEIYTAYWLGMQVYSVLMLLVYGLTTAALSSILLPSGFTESNILPFFAALGLGVLYEAGLTSLAFFLITLIKFPAWPIVIIVIAAVSSMIVSISLISQKVSGSHGDVSVFYFLLWMPDIQAATLQAGDLSYVTTSMGFGGIGNFTSLNAEQIIGVEHTDYTGYATFAILTENIVITLGSYLGGLFYFDHHDLK